MSLDVDALEESFDVVAPRGAELVVVFYERLFEANPELASLFDGTDMAAQRQKLLQTLVLLRRSLRDLPSIVPALESLGRKHVEYGVTADHYPAVGLALLAAMGEIAGPDWKPEYAAAWADAYGVLQSAMLRGAGDEREEMTV